MFALGLGKLQLFAKFSIRKINTFWSYIKPWMGTKKRLQQLSKLSEKS